MKYGKLMYEEDFSLLVGLDAIEQFFIIDLMTTVRSQLKEKVTDDNVVTLLSEVLPTTLNAYLMMYYEDKIDFNLSIGISVFVLMGTSARTLDAIKQYDNMKLNKLVRIWMFEVRRFADNYLAGKDNAVELIDKARDTDYFRAISTDESISFFKNVLTAAHEAIDNMTTGNKALLDFTITIESNVGTGNASK